MKSQGLILFFSLILGRPYAPAERPSIMRPQGLPCTGGCTLRGLYGREILQTKVELHKLKCRKVFSRCFDRKTPKKGDFAG